MTAAKKEAHVFELAARDKVAKVRAATAAAIQAAHDSTAAEVKVAADEQAALSKDRLSVEMAKHLQTGSQGWPKLTQRRSQPKRTS
jgi:hypothetical protein